MCIDYLKKVGGLCFYNASNSEDSFIKENFVYWCWIPTFSAPTALVLLSITAFILMPFCFGVTLDGKDKLVGLFYFILHLIPSAFFYYCLFLYKKKYVKYMALYKDYPRSKALYFVLFIFLGVFLPIIIFDLFRESWGV